MKNKIYPCIWFNGNAASAAAFYTSLFPNAGILSENPMVCMFTLAGEKYMGLNGGPMYKANPAISFFVTCSTEKDARTYWEALSAGGNIMMALNKYPWSNLYGWCNDSFGISWQIMLDENSTDIVNIACSLLFTGDNYGKGEEAIHYYASVFPEVVIDHIIKYAANAPQPEGKLEHGKFHLMQKTFMAMDGPGDHQFQFNEAISFVVDCENQEEIDFYWNRLTAGGTEGQCGWLKDKFGISWQIVPTILGKLMNDPEKSAGVIKAFMQMKKFDIAKLMET
jgi:predicted 3-demethylubiquinone-9 3-methyltransferase (glyoxalase superfamily)